MCVKMKYRNVHMQTLYSDVDEDSLASTSPRATDLSVGKHFSHKLDQATPSMFLIQQTPPFLYREPPTYQPHVDFVREPGSRACTALETVFWMYGASGAGAVGGGGAMAARRCSWLSRRDNAPASCAVSLRTERVLVAAAAAAAVLASGSPRSARKVRRGAVAT